MPIYRRVSSRLMGNCVVYCWIFEIFFGYFLLLRPRQKITNFEKLRKSTVFFDIVMIIEMLIMWTKNVKLKN